jgi:uncharacterized membrane protein (UPF0127 family)
MEKKQNKILFKLQTGIIIFLVIIITSLLLRDNNSERQQIVTINNHKFLVEIADTKAKRELGLGNKDDLCEECGMLFIFDDKKSRVFWMKDMRFDIDIIWIEDEAIVDIVENVSHKDPEKKIYSPKNIDKVLELPAGSVEKFGIIVDNGVHYEE